MRFLFLTTSFGLVVADLVAFCRDMDLAFLFEEIWLFACLIGLLALTICALFDGKPAGQDA